MALPWWRRGAIYQIYPRSFADADGDGIGDLRGIAAHLDHLEALGVEAVWLSPFYRSPMKDFGYDVADYTDVDPVFGTLADFDALVAEAHARGIRVIVDVVPNHSSDQHPWFVESRASRGNPKRDWYVWRDGREGGTEPPNGWRSAFPAVERAWSYNEATEQWWLHSFLPEQPDLNWDNPEVEAAIHDVLRFWLDRGVDGFRIDVTQKIAKDPAMRDDVPGEPARSEDWQPTIHERLRRLRAVADAYEGERILVGEVYLLDLERVVAYVNGGDELHLAHNFVFLQLDWDAAAFRASIDRWDELSSEAAWPAWFLSNHDHPRVASRFDEGTGLGEARARAVLLMLYALRGTPFVFQGEELGLPDAEIPDDRIVDVDGRDPERAPIPWAPPSDAGPGAGFTTGEPWLPITAEAERLNVAAQEADPASTLHLTRALARLRAAEPALQDGAQRTYDAGPDVLAWTRGDAFIALVNFAAESRPATLPGGGEVALSSDPKREVGPVGDTITLAPGEGLVLRRSC
ncbi:MAG TPA: alpha-amylase family glycosyl hydrolase [Solirubrobacteraceae bacterium]|nr:alpha-amylase family glycosyl hydrolase [Solirubrobacteraceae bacterium]